MSSKEYHANYHIANRDIIIARARLWRENNRERHRAYVKNWISENRDAHNGYVREGYRRDPSKRTQAALRWCKANPERANENARLWYKLNPERVKATGRRWRKSHPEKVREMERLSTSVRRARKRNALGIISPNIIKQLWDKQGGLCNNSFCKVDLVFEIRMYHLDHIMPLALGGKHEDSNLQLLCARCNLSKGAKHPDSLWELNRVNGTAEESMKAFTKAIRDLTRELKNVRQSD